MFWALRLEEQLKANTRDALEARNITVYDEWRWSEDIGQPRGVHWVLEAVTETSHVNFNKCGRESIDGHKNNDLHWLRPDDGTQVQIPRQVSGIQLHILSRFYSF